MLHEVTFQEIASFHLNTRAPARLTEFYAALGFEIGPPFAIPRAEMNLLGLSGRGSRVMMSIGRSFVALDCFDEPGRPYPCTATACDLVFQHFALVTGDAMGAWHRALANGATRISGSGPVTLPKLSGGVTAVKFRDPEGHPLEFLTFPPSSHSAQTGDRVIEIDHSAVSVRDLDASRRFYTDHGLHASGATVNQGAEQDALDGLDAVSVDVVAMKPVAGVSHLEMLHYRHPIGRADPPLAVNDVAATRIVWRSDRDRLIRDPDGHLHQFSH